MPFPVSIAREPIQPTNSTQAIAIAGAAPMANRCAAKSSANGKSLRCEELQNTKMIVAFCKIKFPIMQLHDDYLPCFMSFRPIYVMITLTFEILGWEFDGIGFEAFFTERPRCRLGCNPQAAAQPEANLSTWTDQVWTDKEWRSDMLQHVDVWRGIDRLAAKYGLSASGPARRAGLDPTAFNPSKRITREGRPRWPSTQSLSQDLAVTGESFSGLVALTRGPR